MRELEIPNDALASTLPPEDPFSSPPTAAVAQNIGWSNGPSGKSDKALVPTACPRFANMSENGSPAPHEGLHGAVEVNGAAAALPTRNGRVGSVIARSV